MFYINNTVLDIHYFDSPLGTIKVKGDVAGVQEVLFVESALEIENKVPISLVPCVEQLQQFAGKRHAFDFKMNPQGTDFQKNDLGIIKGSSLWEYHFLFKIITPIRQHKSR